MVELPVLRTTAMQSFRECPRRWSEEHVGDDGDIDTEDRDDGNQFTERGKAVHRCCEAVLRGAVDVDDEAQWDVCELWLKQAKVPRVEKQAARDYCGELQQRRRNTAGWSLLAVEARFVRPLVPGAPPVKGTPDVIWVDREQDVLVIQDHKTNRQYRDVEWWRRRLQQRTYAWAVREALGRPARGIDFEIGYVNLGLTVRWRCDPDDMEALRAEYADLWDELRVYHRTGEWPERLNSYCSSCPVLVSCAQALEAVDSLAFGFTPPEEGPLARMERLKASIKLAEAIQERAKEDVLSIVHREGICVEGGLMAELRDQQKRSAEFWLVWRALESLDEVTRHRAMVVVNDLFSVKLGELDQLTKRHPGLADLLEHLGAITVATQERLTVRRV